LESKRGQGLAHRDEHVAAVRVIEHPERRQIVRGQAARRRGPAMKPAIRCGVGPGAGSERSGGTQQG